MTLDVLTSIYALDEDGRRIELCSEAFCMCRHCHRTSVLLLLDGDAEDDLPHTHDGRVITDRYSIEEVIRPRLSPVECPEHVPADIAIVFSEGTECFAIECWNAAGAMFRKVVDLVSKARMPEGDPPDAATKRILKRRLDWLFVNNHLPRDVQPLADCIREDGNDAVHEHPLGKAEAEDLLDFTVQLLEGVYTTPGKLAAAAARRAERRKG